MTNPLRPRSPLAATTKALALLALALLPAACKSKPPEPPLVPYGETLYSRVGMHFDNRGGRYLMYSTNYVAMPHYVPPGTAMTLSSMSGREVELQGDDGATYEIRFMPKHSMMTINEWVETNFSTSPVSLPDSLNDDERDAIASGDVREGMSRDAVFLAWGYPPKSTNPSNDASTLEYEWRKPFIKRHVRFGSDDRVERVGN